jgi:hypothetical protein
MNWDRIFARVDFHLSRSTSPTTEDADIVAVIGMAQRQVRHASAIREERSARIEAAIRAEGGMLPATMAISRRVAIVSRGIGNRLDQHELGGVPCARIIRRGLRKMDAQIIPVTSTGNALAPVYSRTIATEEPRI